MGISRRWGFNPRGILGGGESGAAKEVIVCLAVIVREGTAQIIRIRRR